MEYSQGTRRTILALLDNSNTSAIFRAAQRRDVVCVSPQRGCAKILMRLFVAPSPPVRSAQLLPLSLSASSNFLPFSLLLIVLWNIPGRRRRTMTTTRDGRTPESI